MFSVAGWSRVLAEEASRPNPDSLGLFTETEWVLAEEASRPNPDRTSLELDAMTF